MKIDVVHLYADIRSPGDRFSISGMKEPINSHNCGLSDIFLFTWEIGIRIALGARLQDGLKMVLGAAMKLAAMGGVVGLLVASAFATLGSCKS
jgi:hypothetical protein